MTTNQARAEIRRLMDAFPASSQSHQVRVELSDTVVAAYSAGHISRGEYLDYMGVLR